MNGKISAMLIPLMSSINKFQSSIYKREEMLCIIGREEFEVYRVCLGNRRKEGESMWVSGRMCAIHPNSKSLANPVKFKKSC